MKWEVKVVTTNGHREAEVEGMGWEIVGASVQTDVHRTHRWVELILARLVIDRELEL